jgi:hypothetical protein
MYQNLNERSPAGAAHFRAVARQETPRSGGQAAAASATQSPKKERRLNRKIKVLSSLTRKWTRKQGSRSFLLETKCSSDCESSD